MVKLLPHAEVLYDDLYQLGISSYLSSREFKLKLLEVDVYHNWVAIFEFVKSQDNFVTSYDFTDMYLLDTLKVCLNQLKESDGHKLIVTHIITNFIETSPKKLNLANFDVVLSYAGFDSGLVSYIQSAIKVNQSIIVNENRPIKMENDHLNLGEIDNKKVFIVHGHDTGLLHETARVVSNLKLDPIILHEQSNKGQTIIEKFESNSNVGFVIVLLTPDDVSDKFTRARQNVIFEMGFFYAKLGRHRVFPLYVSGVELPSDLSGVLYTLKDEAGTWKYTLVNELNAAGFKVSKDDL